MTEPVKWIFFCSEADYPMFRDLPLGLAPTYSEFVVDTDRRIKSDAEQVTREKVIVGYGKFIAYCKKKGKEPDWHALDAYTLQVWGEKE